LIDPTVRAELLHLETALASRDARTVNGGLPSLIADDFLELGASGAVRDAEATRRLVASEPPTEVVIDDFAAAELSPGLVLVTYRVVAPRPSNRSSIWQRRDGHWVVRFHQGTPLPG
jgi:hypothetical protein